MTAITEYGVRRAHPVTGAERIQWPTPGTGLLALPGGTVDGTDLDGIWEALKAHPSLEGASVVVRSYDVEEVPKPAPSLPTTPGSVVRAGRRLFESLGPRLWVRGPDGAGDGDPGSDYAWQNIATMGVVGSAAIAVAGPVWSAPEHLTDVEILFDAGTAP